MRLLTFFTLLCCSLVASAATVKNLYNVKVPVEDQTEEARIDAIGGAFQRVLVRMAGTRVVLDNTLLVNEQPNAQNYMSSLRYERSEEGGLLLSVTFMPDQLQALLERASAPLWGESRPRLLLLLAVNTSDGRIIIGPEEPEDTEKWKETFATAMHDRGLPWMFPSWDLEDQMALPIASLWGLFEDDIDSAAERYSSDGYLVGRIMATPGAYSFTGYLNQGDIYHAMSLQAESSDSLSTELAGAVAEKLSERYAVIPLTGIDNSELIRISGVSSFADYHAVIEYLDAHVAVRDVVVVSTDRDQLTLALDLTTSWQQVFDSMVLDNRILFNEEGGDYAWQR